MSQGQDREDAVTVSDDGVTVEKRFAADEFPVPAIEFTLRSDREAAAEFRLVDEIPQDFPMDRIGFHPEYESEHWTAYQDHRVEYRRRLEPGEEVVTVYGIRTDAPDEGGRFLGEPTVAEVDEDDDPVGDVADVIGDDSSQAVRDVLAGDVDGAEAGDTLGDAADDGGLDLAGAESDLGVDVGPADPDSDAEGEGDGPAEPDDDLDGLLGDLDGEADAEPAEPAEPVDAGVADEEADDGEGEPEPLDLGDADGEAEAEPAEPAEEDGGPEPLDLGDADRDADGDDPLAADGTDDEVDGDPDGPDVDGASADDADATDTTDETDIADEPRDDGVEAAGVASAAGAGGIAAALAEELRAGTVSAEDRETLTEELELNHSTSVDARIARLQSKVEDVAAYSDAMEEFIDDNGFAGEWMDGLQADLDELAAELADAAAEREAVREEVDEVRGDVDDWGDELVESTEELESSLAEVRTELDELAEEVADEDEEIAELRDGLAALGDDVESVAALVDDEIAELRTELEAVHDDLEEFEQFRDRLSSVFGPNGPAGGSDE